MASDDRLSLGIPMEMTAEDLARYLVLGGASQEALLELIKEIDLTIGDWDFSRKIIDWARELDAQLTKEEREFQATVGEAKERHARGERPFQRRHDEQVMDWYRRHEDGDPTL